MINGTQYLIDPPKLAPEARMQRRLSFRNQQTLYKRTCDLTGAPIISIYAPDSDQKVFSQDAWWEGDWDPLATGRDYDFTRTFFDQFKDLMRATPHMGMLCSNIENSDFTNQNYNSRDCYLSSSVRDCEGALYCQFGNKLTDCTDNSYIFLSTLLYQCTDCYDSYHCVESTNCVNCNDCYFCYDCIGCKNCIGCTGLRNQEFCIENKVVGKEAFEKHLATLKLESYAGLQAANKQYAAFIASQPHRAAWLVNCEASTGNNLKNCQNARNCFDCQDVQDMRDSAWIYSSKDIEDCYGIGIGEINYDCLGVDESQRVAFSFGTSMSSDCYYTDLCFYCHDCFGCVSLKNKKHCILNKEYTQQEYEELLPKVIDHMKSTGEWGEFFSPNVSAFAYNESMASQDFPLSREEALARGYRWKDDIDQPLAEKTIDAARLPDSIRDIPDDILNWGLLCIETGRAYKLTKKELDFYRTQGLPVPRIHPQVRMEQRMQRRDPQKLWNRPCARCNTAIDSSIDPARPEPVYCEECYRIAIA